MQERECFSHQCKGEAPLGTRLKNAGWLTKGLRRWRYGENIGWGRGEGATPEAMVNAWMNNPSHRDNILDRSFDEVGVGHAAGTISSPNETGSVMTIDFGFKAG